MCVCVCVCVFSKSIKTEGVLPRWKQTRNQPKIYFKMTFGMLTPVSFPQVEVLHTHMHKES